MSIFVTGEISKFTPIYLVTTANYSNWLADKKDFVRNWLNNNQFKAKSGNYCLLPDENGQLYSVIVGCENTIDRFALGSLFNVLPTGVYRIMSDHSTTDYCDLALGFGLGAYQCLRYKKQPSEKTVRQPQLWLPEDCSAKRVEYLTQAIHMVRDLINRSPNDMTPQHLTEIAQHLADSYRGQCTVLSGDELLKHNYPMIYTVGRASEHPPVLIDLRFNLQYAYKVTLVGKGVCFDSGGLDIKPAIGMRWMKKDMAGAAHVLGLAQLILDSQLPIQLRILIPAVENVIDGRAYRPGDVLTSRQGLTVEIDNTDAEGRLILADALTEASSESPDLLIDFATLTGAARVAVGTEISALFSPDNDLADALLKISEQIQDPMWRLPLYSPYRDELKSNVADITNASAQPYGGAITAALFLKEFVKVPHWAHFDLMAWNNKTKPGRPEGGEAMAIRTVFDYLCAQVNP